MSTQVGFGHLSRCMGLARAFAKRRISPTFVIPQSDVNVNRVLRPFGWKVVRIQRERTIEHPRQFLKLSVARNANCLVIDTYAAKPAYFQWLNKHANKYVVQFDDFLNTTHASDFVITTRELSPKRSHPAPVVVGGPRYIPLPPNVIQEKRLSHLSKKKNPFLLVSLGMSDATSKFNLFFKALSHLSESISVHIAASRKQANILWAAFPQAVKKWTVHVETRMTPLYRQASLAICGGGMTSLELAHWGVPMLCLRLASNQTGNIEHLVSNKCAEVLEFADAIHPGVLEERVTNLLRNTSRLKSMSRRGQRLVDGRGADRIVDRIKENARWN